jgi:mRNA-degrading endonuclease RelE of RelBE toxin-antitoxin system
MNKRINWPKATKSAKKLILSQIQIPNTNDWVAVAKNGGRQNENTQKNRIFGMKIMCPNKAQK